MLTVAQLSVQVRYKAPSGDCQPDDDEPYYRQLSLVIPKADTDGGHRDVHQHSPIQVRHGGVREDEFFALDLQNSCPGAPAGNLIHKILTELLMLVDSMNSGVGTKYVTILVHERNHGSFVVGIAESVDVLHNRVRGYKCHQ